VLAARATRPPARFRFEEGAGLVPVEILQEAGRVVGAELTAPQPLSKRNQFSSEQVAACISLSAADIRTDRHQPQIVSVALPFLVAELTSREALRRASPDAAGFARILPDDRCDAIYFYTRDVPPGEMPGDIQARMFFPGSSSLIEDPATGSATVATAALLSDLSGERDGELKMRVGQGVDMGRPSLLLTRIVKRKGVVVSSHIGGRCVPMMEGTFRLAGEG
jgi:trans-2,3-dihydro-3-hydroxyanthranilate isomerase